MRISICGRLLIMGFVSLFAFNAVEAGLPTQAQKECDICAIGRNVFHRKTRHYFIFNYPTTETGGQTLLTGIRGVKNHPGEVYITGFYNHPDGVLVDSFVYKGRLSGRGTWNVLSYPSALGRTVTKTNLYGPNNGADSRIQVVGNYVTLETNSNIGCLYQGALDGSGEWTTLIPTSVEPVLNTIAHSTMGGLVVGNYSTQSGVSKAFIYDIKLGNYHEIVKPEAVDITAYGIWHNGGHSYTICGGYSDLNLRSGLTSAYLVDWNNHTHELSNWRSFDFDNDPVEAVATHFDGITSDGCNGYNLTGDWFGLEDEQQERQSGFFCHVKGNKAKWSSVSFPGSQATSGNSIYKKVVIGSYISQKNAVNGYISILR